MKKSLANLILLSGLTVGLSAGLSGCQQLSAPSTDPSLSTLADSQLHYYRQQAAHLADELNQLNTASAHYCQAPSIDSLQQVKNHWRQSFAAWTGQQGQSGGPLDAAGLSFAFQFWPDKKDSVAKQVQRELSAVAKGEPVPDRGIVTTLNAVEYLLTHDVNAQQRCLLLPGISQQLANNGQLLQKTWQDPHGYQQQLGQMQQQGGASALLTQALGQLAHSYDRLEKKLVLPLNTAANPRPLFAESWRSQQSLYFLRTSLTALQQEYNQGGLRNYLQSTEHNARAQAVDDAFSDALAHLPAGDSLAPWLTGDDYAQLLRFKVSLDQLGSQLKQALPSELGISLGFNATDGD